MRALKISENHGLWVVETSAGVRTSGASLQSALDKMLAFAPSEGVELLDDGYDTVRSIFASIRESGGGQISHGQASA